MKIAIISQDTEIIEKIKEIILNKYADIEIESFGSGDDFFKSQEKKFDLIIVDYKFDGDKTGIDITKELKERNYNGLTIGLSPNLFLTNDFSDAEAKIAIMRKSIELLESILIGMIDPLSKEEVEKKYDYNSDE